MSIAVGKFKIFIIGCATLLLWCGPISWAAAPDAASGEKAAKAAPFVDKAVLRHVDQHLAHLKTTLAITAAQQPIWHGFAEVMRTNAAGLSLMDHQRKTQLDTMNAVANMESYAAIAGRRANDMTALTAAFHVLYSVLTSEQQHKADHLFRAEARHYQLKRAP
jgi:hypothetical protein